VKEAISALETPEVFEGTGRFPGAYFKFIDVLKRRLEDVVNNSVVSPIKQGYRALIQEILVAKKLSSLAVSTKNCLSKYF